MTQQPFQARKKTESYINISGADSFLDGRSILNDTGASHARPRPKYSQPPINMDIHNTVDRARDIASPRHGSALRTLPYQDARSPLNDRLRQDFYTGQYQQKFQQKTPLPSLKA